MEKSNRHKLPVFKIFIEALALPNKYSSTLLKFGAPFLVVTSLLLIWVAIYTQQEQPIALVLAVVSAGAWLIFSILIYATLIMAVIACHRIFLLDAKSATNIKPFRWTIRETRFVGWGIVIGIGTILIALPIMFFLVPLFVDLAKDLSENKLVTMLQIGIISTLIFYVTSRWSLVLPATAIDSSHLTISWAWGLSSGNGWRLTLLLGFLPFMTDLAFNFLPSYDSILYSIIKVVAWLVIGVIEIGLLSLSYAYLFKQAEEADNIL